MPETVQSAITIEPSNCWAMRGGIKKKPNRLHLSIIDVAINEL